MAGIPCPSSLSKLLMLLVSMMMLSQAAAAAPPAATTSAPAAPPATGEDANARVRKALEIGVPKLDFTNLEFKDVVEYFRTAGGLNIHVNWGALQAAGVDKSTPVTLNLQDTTLGRALQLVLEDLSQNTRVTYALRDGILTISTKDDLSKTPETRLFYVGDLVAALPSLVIAEPAKEAAGNQSSCASTNVDIVAMLTDTLKSTVDRDSWEPAGTVGSMRIIGDDLLVRQTNENLEAVGKLLDQMRASVDGKRVQLGVAVVRMGQNQGLKDLREGLKDAKDVASALSAGVVRNVWTLDRSRVEQTLLRKSTRFSQTSGKDSIGYDASVMPVERRKDSLLVSVDFSSNWMNNADEVTSGRDSINVTVPAGSYQLVELSPAGKSGGATVLVLWWQEAKK